MARNKALTGKDRAEQDLRNKAWLHYALNCGVGVICPGCGAFTRRAAGVCRKCEAKAKL